MGHFQRVMELSKIHQTLYRVSSVYLQCSTKGNFAIACLAKKLVFHTEICKFREKRSLTIRFFQRVKELSKSSQSQYEVLPV